MPRNTPIWSSTIIDEILEDLDVEERIALYFEQDAHFRDMIAEHASTKGNVIITDLRGLETIYTGNRFTIYSMYPEQNVSVWITDGKNRQNCAIAVGHSILNRTCTTDVGSLLLRYGGGGHFPVGTYQVSYEDTDVTINEILDVLIEAQLEQKEVLSSLGRASTPYQNESVIKIMEYPTSITNMNAILGITVENLIIGLLWWFHSESFLSHSDISEKQNLGEKIKGKTFLSDNRTWVIDGKLTTGGNLHGVYSAEDPMDQGIGTFFLKISPNKRMFGLWSEYDSVNSIVNSGKYSFIPTIRRVYSFRYKEGTYHSNSCCRKCGIG